MARRRLRLWPSLSVFHVSGQTFKYMHQIAPRPTSWTIWLVMSSLSREMLWKSLQESLEAPSKIWNYSKLKIMMRLSFQVASELQRIYAHLDLRELTWQCMMMLRKFCVTSRKSRKSLDLPVLLRSSLPKFLDKKVLRLLWEEHRRISRTQVPLKQLPAWVPFMRRQMFQELLPTGKGVLLHLQHICRVTHHLTPYSTAFKSSFAKWTHLFARTRRPIREQRVIWRLKKKMWLTRMTWWCDW